MENYIPKIRFKGAYDENGKWVEFTHPWEQRKVSEMFMVTRGYVLPATDTSEELSDEMPYPVYSSQTKDNGLMGYYSDYLYEDAITWTTDGANAGTVNFRDGKFYCTNVCGVLLSDKVEASKAVAEVLNNVAKRYVSYVGNPKLMNNVMADIQITIPTSREERARISSYFSNLDHLITLHQRKCDLYQQAKQSMMEKLYSFNSDWEEKQLGEILYEYNEKCEKNGRYEHVSLTKDGVIPKSDRYNRDFLVTHEDKKYRITHLNDICYNPANLKFGVICRNKYGDGIFSPIYITFKVKDFCDPVFIEYLVTRNDFIQQALQYQQGTVYERMSVMPVDLLSMKVFVPNIEEQIKIANILSKYDELIAISKNQLDSIKTLKKGLLQQMFI